MKEQVRDKNFQFCKYPEEVCEKQCVDCKSNQMWGERNLD
jgi:hypothetical protein